MSLINHLPRWAQRLLKAGSLALGVHDALEDSFSDVTADRLAMDHDTVIGEATARGLDRWGIDLGLLRMPGQSDSQYAAALATRKAGQGVNTVGIKAALDPWGYVYSLQDAGIPIVFWDNWFFDQLAPALPVRTIQITWADPFGGATPTTQQKADALTAIANAIAAANQAKAAGIHIISVLPSSLL